jgi:hypothetical protein
MECKRANTERRRADQESMGLGLRVQLVASERRGHGRRPEKSL